jgi:carboxylesterase type B
VAAYALPVDATLAAYRAVHPGASPGDLLAAIQTDWYWRIPAIRLADAHASRAAATYMYEFTWRSPQFGGRLGACHALEIPFVFDTLGHGTETLWGPAPPQSLADAMHAAWVAFATGGDPGWPRYDLRRRATMRFGEPSEVVDDPQRAERALWEGVR